MAILRSMKELGAISLVVLRNFGQKPKHAAHAMPGWKKIDSEIAQLRKSDPLLRYLQHARNADEHSVQELATEWDAKITAVTRERRLHVSWQPWDRPLLPVQNRGVTYNPPRTHLSRPLEPLLGKGKPEPIVMAELALAFYVDLFNRVSDEVVGNRRDA